MVEFAYNNSTNASIDYMPFKLNGGYYSQILYEKEFNLRFQSKSADKLSKKPRQLMVVYCKNLYHAQKFQKRAHNTEIKP